MTIVIIPGQFAGVPHPAGKLASTLLSVTVAGLTDSGRFRRGKAYAAQRAVTRISVEPGLLVASVAGSRSQPYQVMVNVPLVARVPDEAPEALRTQLTRLTPEPDDLVFSCSCPDDDEPCKHVVAAILAFAEELVSRPELMVQWRCDTGDGPPPRQRVGARARQGGRHLQLAGTPRSAPERPAPPWESPEWIAFLGGPPAQPGEVPSDPVPIGRAMLGVIDLAAIVRSAVDVLTFDD